MFASGSQRIRASASVLPVNIPFISIIIPSAPPDIIRH